MNRNLLSAIGLTVVLAVTGICGCSQGSAVAEELPQDLQTNATNNGGDIYVTGRGEITIVPDIATLRLGIEAQEDTVTEAQAEASKAMNKVIAALKSRGIAEKDIQTQCFSIRQKTKWDRGTDQEIIIGYEVRNIVSVKIRDLDKIGTIIDAAARAGGSLTRIEGISFSVEEPTTYNRELREKAMVDAEAKAKQMAEFFGITLGKPTHISEGYAPTPPIYNMYSVRDMAAGEAPTPISAGETKLSLSIQVTYAILG